MCIRDRVAELGEEKLMALTRILPKSEREATVFCTLDFILVFRELETEEQRKFEECRRGYSVRELNVKICDEIVPYGK